MQTNPLLNRPSPPDKWKQGWSGRPTSSFYDERYGWGKVLAAAGAVLWVIAVVVYIAVGSREDVGNAISGVVWGAAIFGFGSFTLLCGVILIAGAQRLD